MWMEKMSRGVLRVLTPIGPRYIRPVFLQRVYLLWVFRHFHNLPQQVLSRRQQRLIDDLCTSQEFVSLLQRDGLEEVPVIGTVERLAPALAEGMPQRMAPIRVAARTRQVADQQTP